MAISRVESMQQQVQVDAKGAVKYAFSFQPSLEYPLLAPPSSPAKVELHRLEARLKNLREHAAESRLLARLHGLLQRMPPKERRKALEARFAEAQRQALEKWILAHRSSNSSSPGWTQAEPVITTCSGSATSPQLDKKRSACHVATLRKKLIVRPRTKLHIGNSKLPANASTAAALGIMRNQQKGGCFYSAQVSVGSLRLMSKADRNLGTVLSFRDALLSIRHRVLHATSNKFAGSVVDGGFERQLASHN
jgi:hypothetical protein